MSKNFYKPRVMMSIHGIASLGKWQSIVTDVSKHFGLISLEYKYGFTILPWFNNRRARRFKEWYLNEVNNVKNDLAVDEPFHRPSIIAHSLGTWVLVKALKKYPDIKFDKIFLHGSIVPRDYDWYSLILNDQVSRIVIERTKKDLIIQLGFFITGSIFPSSKFGFIQEFSSLKYEDIKEFGHSDFQYTERFKSQFNKYLFEQPYQLKLIPGGDLKIGELDKYFKTTSKIDAFNYGEDYLNNPIKIKRALQWADIEKNIWSFLINSYNKEVVGYINVLALDDNTYNQFLKGNINEDEIFANNIISFDIKGSLNLVIMSIALNEDLLKRDGSLMNSKPGELLTFALSKKILDITNRGKRLNSIASIGWTIVGEKLSQSFGLIKSEYNYNGYPIYSAKVKDITRRKNNELRPLCKWWINQLKKS